MMLVDVLAKSGEAAKSGPIGLAVILILCIVCYFLFKSMSKHLKTVREQYPQPKDDTSTAPLVEDKADLTADLKADSTGQE
jgi:hypothetical protein